MLVSHRPLFALFVPLALLLLWTAAPPALAAAPEVAAPPAPPVARASDFAWTYHGKPHPDPYAWLRNKGSDEVVAHLTAENAYTEALLAPSAALRDTLYQEMVGRIQEDDVSVPVRVDDFLYYHRVAKGLQYPIHCRKAGSEDATEEVILDVNREATGETYFRVAVFAVSPDHRLLAWSSDTRGDERYTLRVRDLATGRDLPDAIPNTSYSCAWSADSKALYYTTLDSANRSFKLHRHRLGEDPAADETLFHETDEAFNVGVYKTRDRKYLLRYSGSQVSSEIAWCPADAEKPAFTVIHPRAKEIEYDVDHRDGEWFLRTNEGARNFRILRLPVGETDKTKRTELVPHDPDVMIDGFDLFAGHMALLERRDGLMRLRVVDLATGGSHEVALPEAVGAPSAGRNPTFATTVYRFGYTSLIQPASVYDYDMATRALALRKMQTIPSGYDRDRFATERLLAVSHDGATVPVLLAYRKDVPRDGSAPCYLYGYGAYGITMDPEFSTSRLSLLERGFVFALAQVRGGADKGRPWYEDGKYLKKKNSFLDLIACAEHLIAAKYTATPRLAISGGSAGGLLVGAALTMRPDLFGAVVADVPFVDSLNTMMDATLPLTVGEYEEWGDPNDPVYFEYMKSYAPYENIRPAVLPAVLATGGYNDPRVNYWEPAKFVARLRAAMTGGGPVLLRTKMGEGHAGASGRYDYLKDIAFEHAFLLQMFDVK